MKGLIYIPCFISQEESEHLISYIDTSNWRSDIKRRTQQYGYKYDYTKKKIDDSMFLGPLPDWLNDINAKVGQHFGHRIIPDQVIVNEYQPGQGIDPHVDCETCFGPVVASLSLLSTVEMKFKFGSEVKSMLLEPRSLLLLKDDARNFWTHNIERVKYDLVNETKVERKRRVSLTFRTVLEDLTKISDEDRRKASDEGYSAGLKSDKVINPYKGGSALAEEWYHGYNNGRFDIDSDGINDGG